MSKVVLQGTIFVPETDLAAVVAALPLHAQLTRSEPGCMQFEVKQEPGEPNVFSVYEEFADRQAFEAHQLRSRASEWGEIAANVIRRYEVKGLE